jgi:hypothetical protein
MEKSGRKNKANKAKKGVGKIRPTRAKKDRKPPAEEDLISALDHHLRRQILRIMHLLDRPVSPCELEELLALGGRLGSKLSMVSYHVTVLSRYNAIFLAGTRPARGALEHFYASAVTDVSWLRGLLDRTKAADKALLWPKLGR